MGISLLGGFCPYLGRRYRRNRVCQFSICCVAVCHVVLYYLDTFWNIKFGFEVLVAMRVVLGAFLGLAQMTLASTLVIDTCESFQRTEANYITSWFARFSIATGPVLVWLICIFLDMRLVFPVASLLALGALVLVSRVKFPFKAPADHMPLFSSDRFFLPQGIPLFVNIVLIMASAGMYFAIPHDLTVYLMLLAGLVVAVIAEKYVFADADLKSQVIVGLILIGAAEFVSLNDQDFAVEVLVPVLLGYFDRVLTSEDFAKSKPDPDCYLKGAACFGAQPSECVGLEDSFNGLKAVRASGAFTLGLSTTNSAESIAPYSDYVIPDYEGFTFADLVKIVDNYKK